MGGRVAILMALVLSVLTHVRAPDGPLVYVAGYFKIAANAISPLLALYGTLIALIGAVRRNRLTVLAGAVTSAFSLRYIGVVTAPHNKFERTFGQNWRSRIPASMLARMRPHRFTRQPFMPPPVPVEKDVVIGTHDETGDPLLADVWTPPGEVTPSKLAVVYLHGSAWHYLHKDVQTGPFFRHLAGQGHVVLDVDYTLAPKADLPAMVADVKRAVAWIKQNADRYGVDPERIVLMGGSAGAHLALLSAYTPSHPELSPPDLDGVDTSVCGVVSYYGFSDLAQAHLYLQRFPRLSSRLRSVAEKLLHQLGLLPSDNPFTEPADAVASLLGGTPDEAPDMYRLASPIFHVGSHCPPTLLLNGEQDFGIEPSQHRKLYRALIGSGVIAIHVEFPYTDHAFDLVLPQIAPASQAATYDTERFLALLM